MWDWVRYCFKHYAVFDGRAGRPEYWWFYLFTFLGNLVLTLPAPRSLVLPGLFLLVTLIPSLAVTARRMHDTGHSLGWAVAAPCLAGTALASYGHGMTVAAGVAAKVFALLMVAAASGLMLWVLSVLCRIGDPSPNRYGAPAPTAPG
jgi:uncharacterized membrane protein YhaH (DUF805 family)